MSLGDIFSDAISYPFSDIQKFVIVGVISLLASLSSVFATFGIQEGALYYIAAIIGIIFAIILSGYSVDVIKNAIGRSIEIPDFDFMTNFINGLKALVISIVYMIIPIIIAIILLVIFGALGAGIDHMVASLGFASIIIFVLFVLFGIFEIVALARFADTGDLGAALSFGDVFEDAKRIGILKIILALIILFIIIIVASLLLSLLSFIPYIGVIIGSILIGGFTTLLSSRVLGLLYADA